MPKSITVIKTWSYRMHAFIGGFHRVSNDASHEDGNVIGLMEMRRYHPLNATFEKARPNSGGR